MAHLTCGVVPGQDCSDGVTARIGDFVEHMMRGRKVRIRKMLFAEEPFSAQNGMSRPNLKLNRKAIAAKYAMAS